MKGDSPLISILPNSEKEKYRNKIIKIIRKTDEFKFCDRLYKEISKFIL